MKKRILSMLLVMALLLSGSPLYTSATQGGVNQRNKMEYAVELEVLPDAELFAVGDTVTVQVKVKSNGAAVYCYSAYDFELYYDESMLEYQSAAQADKEAQVIVENGTIRVRGYGEDKPFQKAAVNLFFRIQKEGTGEIGLSYAKIDRSDNAGYQNAPDAKIPEEPVVIKGSQFFQVQFSGEGLISDSKVASGDGDYIFCVIDPNLYDYTLVVKVGDEDITGKLILDERTGTYTIPKAYITGDLSITATRVPKETEPTEPTQPTPTEPTPTEPTQPKPTEPTQPKPTDPTTPKPTEPTTPSATEPTTSKPSGSSTATIKAQEYLTLDQTTIYLITYQGVVSQGNVPQYEGHSMYWSEPYNAYVWLIADTGLPEVVEGQVKTKITVSRGSVAGKVNYSGNIDSSLHADRDDVLLVLDLYNAKYTLEEMEMLRFLNADLNCDKRLNVQDAVVLMNILLKSEEAGT